MTLTQPPSPLLQAIHRKAQHPPFSTCFFDPWQLTVRSVTQEAAHLPAPRLPLAKKIGRRFLFGASRLRNLPTGQVPRKKNNRTHHATRLQKNRTELGGRHFSVPQLTDRSGAASDPGSSAPPRTTVAACKKIGRRFLFGVSQVRRVPFGHLASSATLHRSRAALACTLSRRPEQSRAKWEA